MTQDPLYYILEQNARDNRVSRIQSHAKGNEDKLKELEERIVKLEKLIKQE